MKVEDVIIVGGGAAGYTAALYAARALRSPLVFEGYAWGGLLQQTGEVENFPGFAEGISGPDLMTAMRDQAQRFGARLRSEDVTAVKLSEETGLHSVFVGEHEYRARALVLATGASHHLLGIPGESEHTGRGVSYCAVCDAPFFKDKKVLVVGGGDSAMEEALFLAKFAREVTVLHRRHEFRASQIMRERVRACANVSVLTPYLLTKILARTQNDSAGLKAIVRDLDDNAVHELYVDGVFVAIGHRPNSQLFAEQLRRDSEGYVLTSQPSTRTSVSGVFAAGDLVDRTYRQAVTAAASGAAAALDIEEYFSLTPLDDAAMALELAVEISNKPSVENVQSLLVA